MAPLCFVFSLFVLIFVFNEKVEAIDGIAPAVDTVQNNLEPVTNNVQLPLKSPLPNLGTTACSTYPHADKGIENFQKMCYTQLYLAPNQLPYKCRKNQFTVGLPLAEVPIDIPNVLGGLTPQAGYAWADAISTTNNSQHLTYNYTYAQAQTAELSYAYTDAANLSQIVTGVIPIYTDKGYVILLCKVDDLTHPICSTPNVVFVCTYNRFPDADYVNALAAPLNQYPYWFGKSLLPMSQAGC